MAYIAVACIAMAFVVMAYIAMAYTAMAFVAMACIAMAYIAMAYIVMAVGAVDLLVDVRQLCVEGRKQEDPVLQQPRPTGKLSLGVTEEPWACLGPTEEPVVPMGLWRWIGPSRVR